MNLKEITGQWLKDNGYDGLYCDECSCELADLMPCDDPYVNCAAGYKIRPCPEECESRCAHDWHISATKKKEGGD